MRQKRSISLKNLILQDLIVMPILMILLVITFLGFAWLTGNIALPEFLVHRSITSSATRLIINTIPENATIKINQKPFDPNSIIIPGDYVIEVSIDGYHTTEENVTLIPNETSYLTIYLVPILSIQLVAEDAAAPGWDLQGNLYFLNRSQGKIQEWTNGSLSSGVDVVGDLYQIQYLPSGVQTVILAGEGVDAASKLFMLDLITGESTDLPVTGFVSLEGDGKTIWGIYNDPDKGSTTPVWSLKLGGSPKSWSLDNPHLAFYSRQLFVDPSGQWLAVETGTGIAVWEIESGKLLATFENASTPIWIQKPTPGLAFLNADNSLNFAQESLNWNSSLLLADVQNPISVMPDGSEIVYSRYNPFVGGTSFWAVDSATQGVRLLSEAKVVSGKVIQFAISLDQKKIAYINDKNELYLVILEP